MGKRTPQRRVERTRSDDYAAVARSFLEAAKVALEFRYFNAAGLLSIHSAIAFADTVTVRKLGERSTAESHDQVVDLLSRAAGAQVGFRQAVTHLTRLLNEKNRTAYTGELSTESTAADLLTHADRFAEWAQAMAE